MPAIANAPVVIDWLVQPCSSAIAIARSLSSSASGSGCPVSGAASARCARQPISMNGREIRTRAVESVLQVLPCVVGTPGPQFRDAQIHQRECPVVRPHGQLVCLCRSAERCLQCAQCLLSLGQIVAPAGELDVEDGQVHVEDAPSVCRSCSPPVAERRPIGRRPRRAGRGGCCRSKARPRDFHRPDGRRPGTRQGARGASRPGRPSSA